MLDVSPNTLRTWERRYGFPRPARSAGGHRQYALSEIESLRATLAETHNVSSAIALARQRGEGPSSASRLAAAFAVFDEDKANWLLEESLALRSIERTVDEVLLDAVATHAISTPEYEFGWRHASGWLSALKRVSPPATRASCVLVLDSSSSLELDSLYVQSLELMLRRAGVRTLTLSTRITPPRLARALPALDPRAVVLAGRSISLDALGRLAYAVRAVARHAVIYDYRGAMPDSGASMLRRLGATPLAACQAVLNHFDERRADRPSTPGHPVSALKAH